MNVLFYPCLMKGLFDKHIKVNSWQSQHWNMDNFFNAFVDEYLAMINGMQKQVYDYANANDVPRVESNLKTLKELINNFKDDYVSIKAKYCKVAPEIDARKVVDSEYKNTSDFVSNIKSRDDKALTNEEQLTRMQYHIKFMLYSIKYDIDCINESKDIDAYNELRKRVANKRSMLIQETKLLGLYDQLEDQLNTLKQATKIDKTKLREYHPSPEQEFKANEVHE